MLSRSILVGLYLLFLIGLGFLTYKKSSNNWDGLAYAAVVLHYNNAGNVHAKVYQAAGQQLPAADYNLLTNDNNRRRLWAVDSAEFNSLMPFYVVKPLYTRLAWMFYRCGLPLFKAVIAPSVLAYILTGILLFVWVGRYLSAWPTFVLTLIVMLLPCVQTAARLASPDFLFAFFILSGLFFIIEKKQFFAFFFSFTLAMLCRIDGIIPLIVLLTFYSYFPNAALSISPKKYLLLMGIGIITYFTISFGAITYGWNFLYFTSFFKTLTTGYTASFSWYGYAELVKAQLLTALYYSNVFWFILISALLLIAKGSRHDTDKMLLQALFVCIIIRFMLQPVIVDRFYLAYYIAVIILLVRHLTQGIGKSAVFGDDITGAI